MSTVTHGASFEVPGGMWRKETITVDSSEFPEAAQLTEPFKTTYIAYRLEQRLLALRMAFGNITAEYYQAEHAQLEDMLAGYLAATAPVG